MNALETLRQKVRSLSSRERKLLAGHLFAVDRPNEKRAAADQTDPADNRRWYTLEEAKALLEKIPPPRDE